MWVKGHGWALRRLGVEKVILEGLLVSHGLNLVISCLCLCLGRSLRQSQCLSRAGLVSLFPGLQTERKASVSPSGSEDAPYMVSLPRAAPVVSLLPVVKFGQVKQRKSSVGRAMVVAGRWSMPVVARRSSQRGSGKIN